MKKGVASVDHPIVQKKINKGLKLSLKDGMLSSVAANFSLSYYSPAALALNATAVQMGILYSIINLLPNLVQLKAASLMERFSRKKLTLAGVIGKILVILPLILVGLLHWMGVPHMIWAFIFLVGFHYACTGVSHPAWFSWMGSLVPSAKRGKYFSRRNRIIGFFGIITMITAALILDFTKKLGTPYGDVAGFTLLGFGILFFISGMFRIGSARVLGRVYEPRIKIRKKDESSIRDFLKTCRETDFGRFSLFVGALSFVIGISAPYWVVYMIRDLNFSYIWYMIIIVAEVVFQLLFLPLLGKYSDKFGNIRLMRLSSLLMAVIPFIWIASVLIESDLMVKIYLMTIPAMLTGFGWAGYNLALNNYVYDAVSARKRGFELSYMNLLIGFGGFFGAVVGALLAWVDVSFMNPLLFIFMVSGLGRLMIALFGSKFLHEVRSVKRPSSQFWTREFAPAQGVIKEVHNIEHLIEKVEHYIVPKDGEEFSAGDNR